MMRFLRSMIAVIAAIYLSAQSLCRADESFSPVPSPDADAQAVSIEDFSSTLPLLIVELDGGLPSGNTDAPLAATLRVVNESGTEGGRERIRNRPGDFSGATLPVLFERCDARFEAGGKGKYSVTLRHDTEAAQSYPLLDLPSGSKWLIHGSNTDKTMLRNYLACTLARKMMPERAPRVRYCELFFQIAGHLSYQGVYLLSEYIVDGVLASGEMLQVMPYAGRQDPHGYLVNVDEEESVADRETFTVVSEVESEAKRRPSTRVTDMATSIYRSLNSTVAGSYFHGFKKLDRQSFIDSYLLNEVMENYTSVFPFYFVRSGRDTFAISPQWDFSESLDNAREPVDDALADTASYPWFTRVFMSKDFIDATERRYYELIRKKILGATALYELMDSIVSELGDARERDWRRWRHIYTASPEYTLEPRKREALEESFERQTYDSDQELLKIRRHMATYDFVLRARLKKMHWKEGLFTPGMDESRIADYVLLFTAFFFLVVIYVRKKI